MSDEVKIFDEAMNLDPKEAAGKLETCVSIIRQCAGNLPRPETAAREIEPETEPESGDSRPVVKVRRSEFAGLVDHRKRAYDPEALHLCDEQGKPIIGTKNRIQCLGRWQKAEKVNPVRVEFLEDQNANAFRGAEVEPEAVEAEMVEPVVMRPAGSNSNQVAFVWLSLLVLILGKGARREWEPRKKAIAQAVTDYEIATGRRIPLWAWMALTVAVLSDLHGVVSGNDEIKSRFEKILRKEPEFAKQQEPEPEPVKEAPEKQVNMFERVGG